MSEPTLIFETVHGSRAYGLDTPESDVDLRGVLVGPREWYFGFLGGPEQLEPSKDHVQWELRKVMRLASLPKAPDEEALDRLCVDIIAGVLG
ncbi:MAG: DNA polymerase beta superfamily protein [Myxococcota bacterium]